MIDLSQLRTEWDDLVSRFHQAAHDLFAKVAGQAAADAQTIGQQLVDDVHTAETDAHQAEQPTAASATDPAPPAAEQPAAP